MKFRLLIGPVVSEEKMFENVDTHTYIRMTEGPKFDLAIKEVKVIPGSSFEQIW